MYTNPFPILQVEEMKHGVAKGTPVAIQQHQDIVAVNYPARAAGVRKHMRPADVRCILGTCPALSVPVIVLKLPS